MKRREEEKEKERREEEKKTKEERKKRRRRKSGIEYLYGTCKELFGTCMVYFELVFFLEYFLWYGLLVGILVGTLVYVRDSSYLGIMFHLGAIFGFVEVLEVVWCFSRNRSTGRSSGWMQ